MAGHGHHDGHGHEHSEIVHTGEHGEQHHVVEIKTYGWVFFWLMVLLIGTLFAAYFDLGPWNLPIAMFVAVVKAMIVVLFFMHVYWSSHLLKVFAGSALMWLLIMFVMTLTDYLSRGLIQVGR